MADEKKVSGWKGALDDEEEDNGIQADLARKILAMNPALRGQGLDTAGVVAQSQQKPAAAKVAAPAPAAGRVVEAVSEIKKALDADEKRLDAEISRLQKERDQLKVQALERLTRWFMSNDPDLRSPVSQQVMDDERSFLARIGFTVKAYVALQKKLQK